MGMYCDVYGVEIKMTGLLADAVEVVLGDDAFEHGVVVLTRGDVREVVSVMRTEILDGWAHKAVTMAEHFARERGGEAEPLSNLQDILHFASDVQRFERLCVWLAQTDEEKLAFG